LVQGVGFRYHVLRRAREANLAGWVRNLPDGSVECVATGPRPALERLVEQLEAGPGRVRSVETIWEPLAQPPPAADFRIVA
jgi:acylphosphatase